MDSTKVEKAINRADQAISGIVPKEPDILLTVILIIILAGIVSRLSKAGINKYLYNVQQKEDFDNTTRLRFVRNGINFLIFIISGLLITYTIPSFRTLAVTLFAGAGIFAAFIAFASQKAFSNIVSGIFIVWFKPFRVGDVVNVSSHFGIVEDITLRHTVIRGLENKRIIIPNSNMSSDVIINSTISDARIQRFVEIYISHDSDLEKAISILKEESLKHPDMIDGRSLVEIMDDVPKVMVRTVGMDEFGIKIRASVWAKDPIIGFSMYCDLIRTVKARFEQEGINIGTPHRTIRQTPATIDDKTDKKSDIL